jgi:hypothetical protein
MKLTIYILTIIAATTLTSCATKKPKVMQTYTVTVNGKEYQYTGDTMINGVRISHSDNAVIWDKNEVDSGTEVLSDTATLIGEPVVEHSEIKDTGKLTVVDGGHWCKPYCKHISTRREGWSGPMKLPTECTRIKPHYTLTRVADTIELVPDDMIFLRLAGQLVQVERHGKWIRIIDGAGKNFLNYVELKDLKKDPFFGINFSNSK